MTEKLANHKPKAPKIPVGASKTKIYKWFKAFRESTVRDAMIEIQERNGKSKYNKILNQKEIQEMFKQFGKPEIFDTDDYNDYMSIKDYSKEN